VTKHKDETVVSLRDSLSEGKTPDSPRKSKGIPSSTSTTVALDPTLPAVHPIWNKDELEKKKKPNAFLNLFRRRASKRNDPAAPGGGLTPLLTPIRVEPKTYFANERTLLQWINIAMFLAIGSIAFLRLSTDTPRALGIGIMVLALLFTIYSLVVYHYRRAAIVSRSVDGHYDDKYGPTVLVVMLFIYILASLVFQLTYVPPVPVTTVDRAIRDYRIPFTSTFLNTIDLTTNGLVQLKNAIQSVNPNFPLKGSFNYKSNQTINWFDSPSSCVLQNNGFILQEITGMDINGGGITTNCALQYITQDLEYVEQLDLAYSSTFFNATEIIRPNNYFYYGRERTLPIVQNPNLYSLQNLANTFTTFFLWDYISAANWNEALVPVNPFPLYVYYYGDINVNFGTTTATKLASIAVYIWYLPDYTPVWGELSLSFPIRAGQDLTKQELLDSKNFYAQLGALTDYFVATSAMDVVDVVYAQQQPKFCI